MNPLPGLFRVTCYLLLVTSYLLLVTSSVSAAQPCANPIVTEKLTDNWITADNGEAPIRQVLSAQGAPGAKVTVKLDTSFTVDFSQLQAIFAAPNSDYLEGEFQKDTHASANLQQLKHKDLNLYYGPGQKAAPQITTDILKVKYVEHVKDKSTLPEWANNYTDTNGQNPKTIGELVQTYGSPNPDMRISNQWANGWGKYWPKIPTAYNEFYEGKLEFRIAQGQDSLDKIKAGEKCPDEIRTVKFVMPDFFRHAALSGQLNSTLVPKAAQSEEANNPILEAENPPPKNIAAKLIQKCFEALSDNQLAKTLRKVIKITLENLNPVKDVYAQTTCIPITKKAKSGQAPFCALPKAEVQSGDSCQNKDDPYKLDKDNPNVICTFHIFWQSDELTIGETGENGFDSCADTDGDGVIDTCYLEVRVWPVFRVPWLAEIWNNSLYSDSDESGVKSTQKTGRPGFYPLFTPQSVSDKILPPNAQKLKDRCQAGNQSACDTLISEFANCLNTGGLFNKFACLAGLITRKLPGEVKNTETRERFIAAPDCSKDFVKNLALLPHVAQTRHTAIDCDSLSGQ